MRKYQKKLTDRQEEDILFLFYRTELRLGEVVIDNTDAAISKELNIKQSRVGNLISLHLKEKIKKIQILNSESPWYL